MDEVIIEGLELKAVIGVHDWERAFAQRLAVDVVMNVDTAPAAASDALDDALDYASVSTQLREIAAQSEFALIETLAAKLAEAVLAMPAVEQVTVSLWKPGAVPAARNVGVRITRQRGAA